ncbi:hypothetical protein [Novosphingobium sp.]|uniref:hypothetical protein n=1 Tax=Novosphingobium sp. TaxID=1874826 RepID=UPI0035B08202
MKELPDFIKDQTSLEQSFRVAEKCLTAFRETSDQSKLESFGAALLALEEREGMSNLAALALNRDCAIWFLGRMTGEIDAATAASVGKK